MGDRPTNCLNPKCPTPGGAPLQQPVKGKPRRTCSGACRQALSAATSGRPSRLLRWEQLPAEVRAAGEALWSDGHRWDKRILSDRARLAMADLYWSAPQVYIGMPRSWEEYLQEYPGDDWLAQRVSYTSPDTAWTLTLPVLCRLPLEPGESDLLGRYLSRVAPRLPHRAYLALISVLRSCNTTHIPRD